MIPHYEFLDGQYDATPEKRVFVQVVRVVQGDPPPENQTASELAKWVYKVDPVEGAIAELWLARSPFAQSVPEDGPTKVLRVSRSGYQWFVPQVTT